MQSCDYYRLSNSQTTSFTEQNERWLSQQGNFSIEENKEYHVEYLFFKEICMLPIPATFEKSFLDKYCLCNTQEANMQKISPVHEVVESFEATQPRKYKTSKKNLLSRYDFPAKAETLLDMLSVLSLPEGQPLVTASKKAEPKRGPICSTRSDFIGVTRNGPQWQSLISVGRRKTYIGSYQTERECAVAFDFHSILLHGLTAKTNFSYSKENMVEMIGQYKQRGNKLSPRTLSFY